MGLFKKIKKAIKKVVSGVKKVFKAVAKPLGKLMQNKAFRAVLLVASIVTGGIALYGGVMGAMGAAGTQAWSTLSLTSKFVTGAKAFVAGAQAAVGSAMGTVKGALGFEGATGGAGIGSSATAAGQNAAISAGGPLQATVGQLGQKVASPDALAGLGDTGLQTGGLGADQTVVGAVRPDGVTAAAASSPSGGAMTAAKEAVAIDAGQYAGYQGAQSAVPAASELGQTYSTGSGFLSDAADYAYKGAQAMNQDESALGKVGGLLSGGTGGLAMMAGGQALAGYAQGKMAADSAKEEREAIQQAEADKEANAWYNTLGADQLNGRVNAPQGFLSQMQGGAEQISRRADQGYANLQGLTQQELAQLQQQQQQQMQPGVAPQAPNNLADQANAVRRRFGFATA